VTGNSVDVLKRRHPEWVPWLAVVDEALLGISSGDWNAAVPTRPANAGAACLLAGASITLDERLARGLLDRLIGCASRCGPALSGLGRFERGEATLAALFRASVVQDSRTMAGLAETGGVDADALQAIAALLPVPFLQACRREWSSAISPGSTGGHCPVCAAWPAYAEIRGIDRSRYLRCGRCGAEWHGQVLLCAYCRNDDHDQMTTLVPDQQGARGVIDACRRCRSYVKAFTRLQGTPPAAVALEDLASVDLDIAALEQGYARPEGAAREFDVTVTVKPAARRMLSWNA
jgi:FdhE protein